MVIRIISTESDFTMFYCFTDCKMMVVKMAATTAMIKYILVKFYYLTYGEHK